MAEKTVVEYDVTRAIQALENLERAQDRIVGSIKDGFAEAGKASERLEEKLEEPRGGFERLSGSVFVTAAAFNEAISLGSTVISTALGIAEGVAEMAFGFETAASDVQEFIDRGNELQEFENLFSSIGDNIRNSFLQRQLRDLGLESAQLRQQMQALDAQARGLRAQGVSVTTTVRDAATGATRDVTLTEREATERRIDSITGATVETKRKLTEAEKQIVAAAKASRDEAVAKIEAEKIVLQTKQAQLRVDRQNIALGAEAERRQQQRDEAAREFRESTASAGQALSLQAGAFEDFINALKAPAREIFGDDRLTEQARAAEQIGRTIQQRLATAQTPGDVLQLEEFVNRYVNAVQDIRDAPGLQLPPTAETILERLKLAGDEFKEAIGSAAQFTAAGGGTADRIEESAGSAIKLSRSMSSITTDSQEQLRAWETIQRLTGQTADNVQRMSAGAAIAPQAPSGPVTQSQLAAAGLLDDFSRGPATPQNVNVQVDVRGGMIDNETARQFAEIVKRELRRGTQ